MAKVYATKIGTDDITGDAVVLEQVELGDIRANNYEMSCVADKDGNVYYIHGQYYGKILADGSQPEGPWNINSVLFADSLECYGLALNRDADALYIFSNSSVGGIRVNLSKHLVNDLSSYSIKNYLGGTCKYATEIHVDKNEYIWISNSQYSSTGPSNTIKRYDENLVLKGEVGYVGFYAPTIVIDPRGYAWYWSGPLAYGLNISWGRCEEDPLDASSIQSSYYSVSFPSLNYDMIIDGVAWTDDTNYYVYILYNNTADDTEYNKIIKADVTDPDNPSRVAEITLTGLTNCYNLHADYDGNVYFSSWGVDGYNTYKIPVGETTFDDTTNLYLSGVGSNTCWNDPFAFKLTPRGCTGASLS